jgi:hypothetical protein
MNKHLAIITAFTLACSSHAQQPSNPPFDRDGFLREIDAGNMSVLEQVRHFPPVDAERILRDVMNQTQMSAPEKAAMAADLMGELPGIPELFQKRLAALPHLIENSSERGLWMSVLARIHKRWALNLLAAYLLDDRPLESKLDAKYLDLYLRDGNSESPNSSLAATLIAEMCRKENLPTIEKPIFFGKKEDEMMREWWRKNQHQPDSFFFSDTKGAIEPTPAARQISTEPNSLAIPYSKSSSSSVKGETPGVVTKSSTQWNVIVVLIVAATGLLWLLLKNRK